ncbi:MAG: hypothetical protein Q8R82_00325 [Hyphomonadaceae bacterium]|nr:hypothetical protein [Hyphomonadaceae bacterium]
MQLTPTLLNLDSAPPNTKDHVRLISLCQAFSTGNIRMAEEINWMTASEARKVGRDRHAVIARFQKDQTPFGSDLIGQLLRRARQIGVRNLGVALDEGDLVGEIIQQLVKRPRQLRFQAPIYVEKVILAAGPPHPNQQVC